MKKALTLVKGSIFNHGQETTIDATSNALPRTTGAALPRSQQRCKPPVSRFCRSVGGTRTVI